MILTVKEWIFPYLYLFFLPTFFPAEERKKDAGIWRNTDSTMLLYFL